MVAELWIDYDSWKQTVHGDGVERTIDLDIIVIKRSQIPREGNVG